MRGLTWIVYFLVVGVSHGTQPHSGGGSNSSSASLAVIPRGVVRTASKLSEPEQHVTGLMVTSTLKRDERGNPATPVASPDHGFESDKATNAAKISSVHFSSEHGKLTAKNQMKTKEIIVEDEDPPVPSGIGSSLVKMIVKALDLNPLIAGFLEPSLHKVDVGSLVINQLTRLLTVENSSVPEECKVEAQAFMSSVFEGEAWALQMLDAMGKPGRGLLRGHTQFWGDFDLCLNVSHTLNVTLLGNVTEREIRGAYYVVSFRMPDELIENIVGRENLVEGLTDGPLTWHLCLPSSCRTDSLNATYCNCEGLSPGDRCARDCLNTPALGAHLVSIEDRNVTPFDVHDATAIAAIGVVTFFVLLVIIATIFDLYLSRSRDKKAKKKSLPVGERTHKEGVANGGLEGDGISMETSLDTPLPPAQARVTMATKTSGKSDDKKAEDHNKAEKVPLIGRLLLAWSLPRNAAQLTNQHVASDSLGCLHGIRVISMWWIILGISIKFILPELENGLDALPLLKNFWFQIMMNTAYAVDTFFVVSGVLTAYLFLREAAERERVSCRQMVRYFVHRVCRLTPGYMLVLLLYAGLMRYLGSGPVWHELSDSRHCSANWWTNLLFVNNLVHSREPCMQWTWYVAASMQLHLIAPLVLVPLASRHRAKAVGFVFVGLMQVTHVVTQSYLVATKWDHLKTGDNDEVERTILPYTRVSPYATGLLLGFVLHRTKCKVKLHKVSLCVGWVGALGGALLLLLITYSDVSGRPWSLPDRTAFEVLHRPAWGALIAWVILACCSGYGGWVNSILSWDGWLPYSRLSYGVFLVHVIVIQFIYLIPRTLFYYTVTTVFYRWVAIMFLCYVLSFLMAVLAEVPFLRVEKMIFHKKRRASVKIAATSHFADAAF